MHPQRSSDPPDPIANLLQNYYAMNGADVVVLEQAPSPLDFLRYVAKNRPFIVKGGCSNWDAVQQWSLPYLLHAMGNTKVVVAQTPHG